MAKGDKVDIPLEARRIKADFATRPDHLRAEIREWVRAGNPPYNWWGHTHTPPPVGARVAYFGRFDLPPASIKAKRFSPCPCCTPNHEKFGIDGRMAWFPDERVVRLIGPRCFAALNREGHEAAEAEFRREEQQRKDTAYLLTNLPKVIPAMQALKEAKSAAEALDDVRDQMLSRLKFFGIDLWRYTRSGWLHLTIEETEVYRASDGSHQTRIRHREQTYAAVSGRFFDRSVKRISPKIVSALAALDRIDVLADHTGAVAEADDLMRRKAAKQMANAFRSANDALDLFRVLKAGLKDENLATIRAWSLKDGAPYPVYIRREGPTIYVGRRMTNTYPIELPQRFDGRIPELPALGETEADAA